MKSQDFYQILGVERNASAEAIRAAYIALMKRCHPDAAKGRTAQAEAKAKAINEAISVLRDPRKKALYDADLRAAEKRAREKPRTQPAPNVQRRARPPAGRPQPRFPSQAATPPGNGAGRKIASTLILLMLMAGGSLYLLERGLLDNSALGKWTPQRAAAASLPVIETQPNIFEIDVVDAVADVNWIFAYGNAQDAIRFSQHCFAELADYPTFRLFDRCVAFDLALQYRLAAGDGSAAAHRFIASSSMAVRHRTASAMMYEDPKAAKARLAKLDRLTVSQIAHSLGRRDGRSLSASR